MRNWTIIGLLALLLGACGGGSGRATTVNPTSQVAATASAAPPVTPADVNAVLNASLLQLSDMPTGWTTADTTKKATSNFLCGTTDLDLKSTTESASVTFQKSTTGPFLLQGVAHFPGDEAKAFVSKIRDGSNCKDYTQTGSNGKLETYHISPLSFPSFADETFALRLSSDPTIIGALAADLVVIRRGSYVILVGHAAISFSGVDSDQTAAFTRQADDKLRAAIGLH